MATLGSCSFVSTTAVFSASISLPSSWYTTSLLGLALVLSFLNFVSPLISLAPPLSSRTSSRLSPSSIVSSSVRLTAWPFLMVLFLNIGAKYLPSPTFIMHSTRSLVRKYATQSIKSYFDLFPKTFPKGGPPTESFKFSPKELRREFRLLQGAHHPDIVYGSSSLSSKADSADVSSLLNKAYTAISNPYSRLGHIIELYHPDHLDISQDDVSKKLIEQFQSKSEESSLEYKNMLMTVLDAHESLEFAGSEEDLDPLSEENDKRIAESEDDIDALMHETPLNWDKIMLEAIRLKYWVNIRSGIKDWEPGKPVHLTH